MKRYRIYLPCMVFFVLILSSAPVRADENWPEPRTIRETIGYKTDSAFYLKERKFRVSSSCDIRDTDNRRITISQLPTPCIAEITYKPAQAKDAICLKLKVVKKLYEKKGLPEG